MERPADDRSHHPRTGLGERGEVLERPDAAARDDWNPRLSRQRSRRVDVRPDFRAVTIDVGIEHRRQAEFRE